MKEKQFSLQGNVYTVKPPTVRQVISIESAKSRLSREEYGGMVRSNVLSAAKALDLIDMIAVLENLIPEFKSDLKVPLLDLSPLELKEISKVYKEEIYPWYIEMTEGVQNVEASE